MQSQRSHQNTRERNTLGPNSCRVLLLLSLIIGSYSGLPHAVLAESSKVSIVVSFANHLTETQRLETIRAVGGDVEREFTLTNTLVALVPASALERIRSDPLVSSVSQDITVTATDASADTQVLADKVWPLGLNGTGVRLAILDTGIQTSHPEFAGRIVGCHTEVAGTTSCEDDNGHGTHVAGIAGAAGVNPSSKGVAPSVLFLVDKVLDSTGSGPLSQVIAGIDWAVNNRANIISMSLGTSPQDNGGTASNCDGVFPALTDAINTAVSDGVVVVAAAGNNGGQGLGLPGCIGSVVAVGAVDHFDNLAYFSSTGSAMNDHGVVAPGVNIYSTWLGGGYRTLSGTSMATPMVSGTVALMLNNNSSLKPVAIRSILFSTSNCVQTLCPNNNIGHGRINALNAASGTPPATSPGTFNFSVSTSPSQGRVAPGGNITTSVTVTLITGTTQSVSLSAQVPSNIVATFSPSSGNPSFTSTLTVGVSADASPGSYLVSIHASNGATTRSSTYNLTVATASSDFAVQTIPTSLSVFQGGLGSTIVILTPVNGFSSSVLLNASPIAGFSTSFGPDPVAIAGGGLGLSVLTIFVGPNVSVGSYRLTITATSGSVSHSTVLTLNVLAF